LDFCLERRSAFSFSCRACGRCCTDKVIMAGPHEILGMSRLLGLSTTEFLARYSDNGGTTLRFEADGRCVFVTPTGCRVHPRRPLVCRLYPLGRAIGETAEERFALFPRQAGCEAEFGTDGIIGDFLESQGATPYLEWARQYAELYRRMVVLLEGLDVQAKVSLESRPGGAAPAAGTTEEPHAEVSADRTPLSSWQDIDASLAEYCAEKGIAVPNGIDESIALHLRAIKEWMDDLESRAAPPVSGCDRG
jgi:Fe-S-cluster containining protein